MVSKTRSLNSIHDPDGYIVRQNGRLLRVMSRDYLPHYEYLMSSRLYDYLIHKNWMLKHNTTEDKLVLKSELVPFISYPYEWSFSQLKNAALLILNIQKAALDFDMTLKDAPANNVQFVQGKAILIDITSLEIYEEGKPWQAYRQFCENFLVPLALASYVSIEALQWLKAYPDGMPLRLVKLIPKRHFISELGLHLYLHSGFSNTKLPKKSHMDINKLQNITNSLYRTVKRLPIPKDSTLWKSYYSNSNYGKVAIESKVKAVKGALNIAIPGKVLDLGCNKGLYTMKIAREVDSVIALDNDYQAIDSLYRAHINNILPLVIDICNPSPANGWLNNEADSFLARVQSFKPNMIVALALIHHLCLKNSIPLDLIASFFKELGEWLLIEFVPGNDKQVIEMLATIDTHYPYSQYTFLQAFEHYYKVEKVWLLADSLRSLYLMRKKYD